MKKTSSKSAPRKLVLRTESIAVLSAAQLVEVAGGLLEPIPQQPHSKYGQTCDSKCSSCVIQL